MARRPSVDAATARARIATVRSLIASGTAIDVVMEWLQTEQAPDPGRGIAAKNWVVSRQTARKYVDRALESIDQDNRQSKDRKQSRNRALYTQILQRLLAQNSVSALRAAADVVDKICKIDGSYDPSQLGGAGGTFQPATVEEAAMMIEHAHATLELARQQGALPSSSNTPAVIDVESVEADDSEPEPASVEQSGHAN